MGYWNPEGCFNTVLAFSKRDAVLSITNNWQGYIHILPAVAHDRSLWRFEIDFGGGPLWTLMLDASALEHMFVMRSEREGVHTPGIYSRDGRKLMVLRDDLLPVSILVNDEMANAVRDLLAPSPDP
jgi:hypothetical protein